MLERPRDAGKCACSPAHAPTRAPCVTWRSRVEAPRVDQIGRGVSPRPNLRIRSTAPLAVPSCTFLLERERERKMRSSSAAVEECPRRANATNIRTYYFSDRAYYGTTTVSPTRPCLYSSPSNFASLVAVGYFLPGEKNIPHVAHPGPCFSAPHSFSKCGAVFRPSIPPSAPFPLQLLACRGTSAPAGETHLPAGESMTAKKVPWLVAQASGDGLLSLGACATRADAWLHKRRPLERAPRVGQATQRCATMERLRIERLRFSES